jgi:hypothetical protein
MFDTEFTKALEFIFWAFQHAPALLLLLAIAILFTALTDGDK